MIAAGKRRARFLLRRASPETLAAVLADALGPDADPKIREFVILNLHTP
jgi:hypothetical protein